MLRLNKNPKIELFIKAYHCLMENAPKGYIPWFFSLTPNGKDPYPLATYKRSPKLSCCGQPWLKNKKNKVVCPKCNEARGSWRQPWARLSYLEAIEWLEQGGNIGLAARKDDPLIIFDIDDYRFASSMPDTMVNKSRKRVGLHGFCWAKSQQDKVNMKTEDSGEARCVDQYVVFAGSYVPTSKAELEKEYKQGHITEDELNQALTDPLLGYYSLFWDKSPITITLNEYPAMYKEAKAKETTAQPRVDYKNQPINIGQKHSALFDLRMSDIISLKRDRVGHPLHSSDTDANFSISDDGCLCHCWRHSVSLNPIQFQAIKSGYTDCSSAGTPHKGGSSPMRGDYGMIFHAWLQAKKDNLIPFDDPIPIKALAYIAVSRKLIDSYHENEKLPVKVYNEALRIVEAEY